MISLNKYFYLGYEVAGDHYAKTGDKTRAVGYYKSALQMDIPMLQDSIELEKKLSRVNKK